MKILSMPEIEEAVRSLLQKYNAESALLFGSYARGDANETSDIDLIVIGGPRFNRPNIFAFAEDLRAITDHDVDAFELSEVNIGTPFHEAILREGVRIA